jgi:betaine-aldehyde dehydrogenase
MTKPEQVVQDRRIVAALPNRRRLFYGGVWHEPVSGGYTESLNPATQESLGWVAEANAEDVDRAAHAAHQAFETFRKTRPLERAGMLREAATIVRRHAEELALIDSADCGNPVKEMVNDANVAAIQLDYFAGLAGEVKGQTIPMNGPSFNFTVREPLGVCARIYPSNHPFMFAAGKIAAPIAAGNTVVIKPPEQAPLSSIRLMELLEKVFPAGVLNCVTGGKDTGAALASHPLVAKVALIGSIPAGKAVMRGAADTLKSLLLELGGKNALIVYPDADLKKAAAGAVRGMNFLWCGQSCGSTSRLFIHESVYEQVLTAVVDGIKAAHKPGIPTEIETTMGCMVSRFAFEKVMQYIEYGKQEGARLVLGGKRPDDPKLANGFFIEPTVFADVRPHMRIAREEIFGPVLSVLKWSDESELFEWVNNVEYGLTCSIWTQDLNTALKAAQRVQAGYIWVNGSSAHFIGAPFGGYKQSGIGREECLEELLEFTQVKNVNITLEA